MLDFIVLYNLLDVVFSSSILYLFDVMLFVIKDDGLLLVCGDLVYSLFGISLGF